ncbi:MAG: aldehyde dehydrogenase family protein [Fulvimonas sp.]|nr:aldehyde dehydrogenase family protein [Fulvimonas sp.]
MPQAAHAQTAVPTVDCFIGGRWAPAADGRYFDDRNPEDDALYARAAHGAAVDVDRAVRAAQQAFDGYRHTLAREREAWLIKAAERLEAEAQAFIDILIDEVGSPLAKARFEVAMAVGYLRAAAGAARRTSGQTLPSDVPGRLSLSLRQPLGVVAAITPFNVPLIKSIKLTAVPLATGNAVVLLPSEEAPMLAARVARLYHEAGLPPGVVNLVTGFGHEIGDALTGHPLVRLVNFTGSSRVGKHIAAIAGAQMKRVTLELGGKNPLVVLADADLDAAVHGAVMGMFLYQGQVCMASSRILVERPLYAAFLERFQAAAEALPMGDLRRPETVIGPLISPRQRERVRTHIKDALDKGATLVTGGGWNGHRCQPTVLADVRPEMTCYAEETFGPVAAVYPVDGFEQALAQANDSRYGLSAAVYTRDLDRALAFATQAHAGMVHVNAPTLHDEPHVPFGGVGDSGFGREGTEVDIDTCTEWKWVTIQTGGTA